MRFRLFQDNFERMQAKMKGEVEEYATFIQENDDKCGRNQQRSKAEREATVAAEKRIEELQVEQHRIEQERTDLHMESEKLQKYQQVRNQLLLCAPSYVRSVCARLTRPTLRSTWSTSLNSLLRTTTRFQTFLIDTGHCT